MTPRCGGGTVGDRQTGGAPLVPPRRHCCCSSAGGGWSSLPENLGAFTRAFGGAANEADNIGFRVACCLAETSTPAVSGLPGWAMGALAMLLAAVALWMLANRPVRAAT